MSRFFKFADSVSFDWLPRVLADVMSDMKTASRPTTKRTRKEVIRQLHERAARQSMRLLKAGDTTCVFLEDNKIEGRNGSRHEAFVAWLYQIDLDHFHWIPGPCLAKLERQDTSPEQFEAFAASLVK